MAYNRSCKYFLFFFQVPLPLFQGHQVLSVHQAGLGGSGSAGLSARLQHAQSAHPPQEPQLPASGLQLQPEARQDPDHKGKLDMADLIV